jgi:hypothetical protein
MIKKLIKFILFITIILILIISYLSFFGINTKKLNNKIKNQISDINKNINLELKSVKLLLDPKNLSLNIKTLEPVLLVNNNRLELESINTNISLKAFINNDFSVDDLHISTKKIQLKDLIQLAKSLKYSPELFILDRFIKDGFLVCDLNLNFDKEGNIKKDYEIKGFIKKGKLDILNKYSVNDLDFTFNIYDKKFSFKNIKVTFNQIKLSSSLIEVKEKNNRFLVNGNFETKKNDINITALEVLLKDNLKDKGLESIIFSTNNNFTFNINKRLKINNINLESKINLDSLSFKKKLPKIKKYLPSFKNQFKLEEHKILFVYKKDNFDIKGQGKISIEDKVDFINYTLKQKNNDFNFITTLNLNKNSLLLNILGYKKDQNLNSEVNFNVSYKKDKTIKFDEISLIDADQNTFIIKGLNLNNKFKIIDINKLHLDFINSNKIKNKISLEKIKNEYKIHGISFDASRLIDDVLNNENKDKETSYIFDNLSSNIHINIKKTYLDKDAYVNDLKGNIFYQNNKINQLNLDSIFSNKKKLTLTINTNKKNEKITTLFSNYPKPLVKRYKFIKGFEEGVLDFYSIKKNGISNSVLNIDNFKVQEVPVLAKLLTLASLQGIADLLTGEGIRFTDFEMKFSNKNKVMTIDELYAIGPAISILMDGYVQREKLISLRGTLVPATTINRTISSIPVIGKILVGKKTGEGVFGVSFKVKGPPKNLKTSVNPIKTLTPRFITRTLEKLKKN